MTFVAIQKLEILSSSFSYVQATRSDEKKPPLTECEKVNASGKNIFILGTA